MRKVLLLVALVLLLAMAAAPVSRACYPSPDPCAESTYPGDTDEGS